MTTPITFSFFLKESYGLGHQQLFWNIEHSSLDPQFQNRNKHIPLQPRLYMKNWTLGKPYRCCWEHLGELIWEHFGNLRTLWEHDEKMLGRHWEQGGKIKNPSPLTPSKRKRQGPSWVQTEPSHWLPESFISKTVCHHFCAGLMVGAEIWWHSVVGWINARVPTSPVAYLRILEPDWKDERTLLKTTLTPKIWKLQTLPFMKDTQKRCAFVFWRVGLKLRTFELWMSQAKGLGLTLPWIYCLTYLSMK
jgi:hypothetical protein